MKIARQYINLGFILLATLAAGMVTVGYDHLPDLVFVAITRFVIQVLLIGNFSLWLPVLAISAAIMAGLIFVTRLSGPQGAYRLKLASGIPGSGLFYIDGAFGVSANSPDGNTSGSKSGSEAGKTTGEGLVMVNDGNIVFANKAFFQLSGYQPEEVFGFDFASIIDPESLIDFALLGRRNLPDVKNNNVIRLKAKNNESLSAVFASGNQKAFDPRSTSLFLVSAGNTAAGNSQHQFTVLYDLFENADTLHWVWDEIGLIYMNKVCRAIMKHPMGKIIIDPWLMLSVVEKAGRPDLRNELNTFYQSGNFVGEIHCRLDAGIEKWYKISLNSNTDAQSGIATHYGVAVDITSEKLKLADANREKERALALNLNKSVFLANMSHEIRSPLNGIIGFSELLADPGISTAERERYMSIIQRNGDVLANLLSDLIDISKIESGKLEIVHRKFMPFKLLTELNTQFNDISHSKPNGVNLKFIDDDTTQHVEIYSDPYRLRQILINLISNAIKFTFNGSIEVGMDYTGDKVMFWVKDTGTGIPYAKQSIIFERFSQAAPMDLAAPVIGFGLGLTISRSLVELLGGNLWMESMPERGSIFQFTINTNIENHNAMEITSFSEGYPYDFRDNTILIAEDIDFSFLYIEAVLRRTGAKIIWAQNGKEALDFVRINDKIDIVLMDMHMPVMTGYEATEQITRLRPDLPVIAQTAFALPDDMKRCYDAGCSGFLAKPIRKEILLSTIAEYLESKEQQPTIGHPALKAGNA